MRQWSDCDRSSYEKNAVGAICRIPTNQPVWIRNNGTSEELEKVREDSVDDIKKEIKEIGKGRVFISVAGETDGLSQRVNCSERGWEMCQEQRENQILGPPHEVGEGIIKTSLQAKWCTNGIFFPRNRLIKCRWNPSNWKMLFITWNTAEAS